METRYSSAAGSAIGLLNLMQVTATHPTLRGYSAFAHNGIATASLVGHKFTKAMIKIFTAGNMIASYGRDWMW
jgi:hypothetical protein